MALVVVVPIVSAPPAAAAPTFAPVRYVALGDSYASGPLIPLQTGMPLGCARSDHNYPQLTAHKIGISDFVDVSCGGATTDNLADPQAVTGGVNGPQLDALDESTGLVTMTMGGNDIGFGQIVTECATRSPLNPLGAACKDFFTSGGTDQLAERIAATAPKIAGAVEAIHQRAPHARVVLVGYPAILPDTGPGCFPLVPFSPGDVAYLRDVEKQLNAMIAEQAEANDAAFVDTYEPTIGHDVCQLPGKKWVEGLVPTAPAAPVHPNALGMEAMAVAVAETVGMQTVAP